MPLYNKALSNQPHSSGHTRCNRGGLSQGKAKVVCGREGVEGVVPTQVPVTGRDAVRLARLAALGKAGAGGQQPLGMTQQCPATLRSGTPGARAVTAAPRCKGHGGPHSPSEASPGTS